MTSPRTLLPLAVVAIALASCSSGKGDSPVAPGPTDSTCTTNCRPDTTTCTTGCQTTPGVAGQSPYTPIPTSSYTGLTAAIKEGVNTLWYGMARVTSKGKSFQMGLKDSLYPDDGACFPAHKVTFTYSFYIEKTEVPATQVADVMDSALAWGWIRIDSTPDALSGTILRSVSTTGSAPRKLFNIRAVNDPSRLEYLDFRPRGDTGFVVSRLGSLPFDAASWYGAALYANAWSRIKGLEPVYDTETWVADYRRNGFRLPTEAEFEYAIRGGTTTTYFWNEDTWNSATAMRYGSTGALNDVDKGGLNPYGLYQVVSNANEWSDGWFSTNDTAPETDPVGPTTGTQKGYRAGYLTSSGSRSGSRYKVPPISTSAFRLVLPIR